MRVRQGGELPKPAAANLRSKTTEVGNSRAGAKKPVGGGDETASNPKTGDYSDEDDWVRAITTNPQASSCGSQPWNPALGLGAAASIPQP